MQKEFKIAKKFRKTGIKEVQLIEKKKRFVYKDVVWLVLGKKFNGVKVQIIFLVVPTVGIIIVYYFFKLYFGLF